MFLTWLKMAYTNYIIMLFYIIIIITKSTVAQMTMSENDCWNRNVNPLPLDHFTPISYNRAPYFSKQKICPVTSIQQLFGKAVTTGSLRIMFYLRDSREYSSSDFTAQFLYSRSTHSAVYRRWQSVCYCVRSSVEVFYRMSPLLHVSLPLALVVNPISSLSLFDSF